MRFVCIYVCVSVGCADNDVFEDPVIQEEVEEPEEEESGWFTFRVLTSSTIYYGCI